LSTTALRCPIKRKLTAHDGTRRRRPMFVQIHPEGVVEVWPRRCKAEAMSVTDIYIYGARLRQEKAKEAKLKASGKPRRVRRGLL
jgi:hypothetical protein